MLNINETLEKCSIQLGEAIDLAKLLSTFLIFQVENIDACQAGNTLSILQRHLEMTRSEIEKTILIN